METKLRYTMLNDPVTYQIWVSQSSSAARWTWKIKNGFYLQKLEVKNATIKINTKKLGILSVKFKMKSVAYQRQCVWLSEITQDNNIAETPREYARIVLIDTRHLLAQHVQLFN